MRLYRATSWLDPRIEVRPSRIDGHGLFARAPIRAGTVVSEAGGKALTDAQLETYKAGKYSASAIDEGVNLLQDPNDPLACGNHSCDPNLWMVDEVTVAARRNIAEGEELTIDYALHSVQPSWSMACHCASPLCRRAVTGDDWRRPELQRRYAGHFSPFINRQIDAQDPSSRLRSDRSDAEHDASS
jgi:hypothetical protein